MSRKSDEDHWNIFDYDQPLPAIEDFLEVRRKKATLEGKQQHWTLGCWARRLGFSSTSVMTNILKGRNTPSPEVIRRLAQSMTLDPRESEYLHLLFERERKKDILPLLREALDRRIGELRERRTRP